MFVGLFGKVVDKGLRGPLNWMTSKCLKFDAYLFLGIINPLAFQDTTHYQPIT